MDTIEQVKAYVQNAIESFHRDPADSDFQKGYKAAFDELKVVLRLPYEPIKK